VTTETEDCRSETGITTGLVDVIITSCRVLAQRDLTQAKEALADLAADEDFHVVLAAAGAGAGPETVEQAAQRLDAATDAYRDALAREVR
jgi:hypothetical protein